MFQTYNKKPNFEGRNLAGSKHGGDKNDLFSTANGDSDRFKKMSQDLQIAAKYSQEETKSKYVVLFGLTPFVKDELITDAQKTQYSFKFDETMTSPSEKAV